MKKIMKNKKSAAGVIILLFFAVVALVGPFFTTLDPIQDGSVPRGKMPAATINCVPEWYAEITGNENYTKNIYVTPDPSFSDPNKLKLWKNDTTEGVYINYNTDLGLDDKGCLEITFTKDGKATISIEFNYTYKIPPKMFACEWSYMIISEKTLPKDQANFTISTAFSYETSQGKQARPASIPFTREVANTGWVSIPWHTSSSSNAYLISYYGTQYGIDNPIAEIFKKPRTYSFEITIQFLGNTTELGNPKFLIDQVNVVIFGNSFGWLGTDNLARDIFTQLIVGTRISFIIGIVSAVVSVVLGLIIGLIAGYMGGAVDEVIMRFTDMLLVIPTLPLLLVLIFVLGQTMLNIILVVGVLGWMGFARTVRASVLSLKERSFIEAVRALGGGRFYIIRKHIIPNVFPLIYVTLAMSVPSAIVSEAALSWLGLGPTDVMSWGRILHEFEVSGNVALNAFAYWYWTIPPGLCIALLSLAFVLIGYALDEILNPRLRER
jgi:peptide/nickel transport system permease protein